jgi:hypothetical protein
MIVQKKIIIAMAISGMLSGNSLTAFAATCKDDPLESGVVQGAMATERFPSEVKSGSIKVNKNTDRAIAVQAKITAIDAAAIAGKLLPGIVVETKLDNENGYLVWEVEILEPKGERTRLKIDAGNGRLLASAAHEADSDEAYEDKDDDENKKSSWKFWEDSSDDEKKGS